MTVNDGWTALEVPNLGALPQRIFLRSQTLPARHIFPDHCHLWNQFIYATSGTLVVAMEGARYVITPEQAIWIPTGVLHGTGALHGAEIRSLSVADLPSLGMPGACVVLSMSPLLRALIVERGDIRHREEEPDDVVRIDDMILDQLRRLRREDFSLPWPRSPILRKLCEALYADPADPLGVEEWSGRLGASPRTLARRFEKELGQSLREWRQLLRLFRAVEWLNSGRNVTDVALELGYASPSAFT